MKPLITLGAMSLAAWIAYLVFLAQVLRGEDGCKKLRAVADAVRAFRGRPR